MSNLKDGRMHIHIPPTTIFWVLFGVAIAYGVWQIRGIILIVLMSVVLASFIGAISGVLERFRIPRVVGVLLVYAVTFGIFGLVLWLFVPTFLGEVSGLLALVPADSPLLSTFGGLQGGELSAKSALESITSGNPVETFSSLSASFGGGQGGVTTVLSSIFGGLLNFVLVLVISFYLAVQKDGVDNFLRVVTPIQHETYVLRLWRRTQIKIASWFKGQLLVAFILGSLTYIFLSILGMPYALVLALLAALFGFVPFGIIIATIPAVVLGFIGGGVALGLKVLAVYVILQLLENNVFQPLIIGKATGVPSLGVLLAVLVGVPLAGFMGLILAIPFAVLILEVLHDYERKKARELKMRLPKPIEL